MIHLPGRSRDLLGGRVEAIEEIGHADHQDQRGELLLVVVAGGLLPDLVGNRVRPSPSRVTASVSASAARSASVK